MFNNQVLFPEQFVSSYWCPICAKHIQQDEEMVVVPEYGTNINENMPYYFHAKGCFEKYKEATEGKEPVKKGVIIGRCGYCFMPVRISERYSVGRTAPCQTPDVDNYLLTTVPSPDSIDFTHTACLERVDKWQEEHPTVGYYTVDTEGITTFHVYEQFKDNKEAVQNFIVSFRLQDAKIEYDGGKAPGSV